MKLRTMTSVNFEINHENDNIYSSINKMNNLEIINKNLIGDYKVYKKEYSFIVQITWIR